MCHETVVIHSPFACFLMHFHGKVANALISVISEEFSKLHGISMNLDKVMPLCVKVCIPPQVCETVVIHCQFQGFWDAL